jgi:hypothetical protein
MDFSEDTGSPALEDYADEMRDPLPGIDVVGTLDHDCAYATWTGVLTLD